MDINCLISYLYTLVVQVMNGALHDNGRKDTYFHENTYVCNSKGALKSRRVALILQ